MTEDTLYARLGGREQLRTVVDDFYDRVLADDRLSPYFTDANVDDLRTHQTEFLMTAADGPAAYDGEEIESAHADLDITGEDFAILVDHLDETLAAHDVADEDRRELVERVRGFESAVVDA
jgi:hemoglobin